MMIGVKGCKCKVCGNEFVMVSERRYTARGNKIVGISNIVEDKEVQLYNAFDCPECGCQNLVNERLRGEEPKNAQTNKG